MNDRRPYIEARIAPDLNSGCWLWALHLKEDGYGAAIIKRDGVFKTTGAHRASWEAYNGLIPAGLSVCHKCDTPACVNPAHLFLGTNHDNMGDCSRKGRTYFQRFGQRTHCQRGHAFTPENTAYRADGARRCQACIDIKRREYRSRLRAGRPPLVVRATPEIDALARAIFQQRRPDQDWAAPTTGRTYWRQKARAALSVPLPHKEPR